METWVFVSMIALWIVVLLNLVLTLALVRRINNSSGASPAIETGPPVGEKAPDFTATTLTGEKVTLASYTGRATTFLFVASHCQPCHDLIKTLSTLAHDVSSELTLVLNGSRQEAEELARELEISLPLLLAPRSENTFFETYKISATPSYCSLNAQGVVQATGIPGSGERHWQKLTAAWSRKPEHVGQAS